MLYNFRIVIFSFKMVFFFSKQMQKLANDPNCPYTRFRGLAARNKNVSPHNGLNLTINCLPRGEGWSERRARKSCQMILKVSKMCFPTKITPYMVLWVVSESLLVVYQKTALFGEICKETTPHLIKRTL